MPRHLPIEQRVSLNVRTMRESKGLTQAELARRAKTSRSQVALVESGARAPTVSTLARFAEALGVDVHQLIGSQRGERQENPPDRILRLAERLQARGTAYVRAVEDLITHLDRVADEALRRDRAQRGRHRIRGR